MRMKKWVLVSLIFWIVPVFAAPVVEQTHSDFLSLSDIHFDPFNSCKSTSPCPLILALKEAKANQWPVIFARYQRQFPTFGSDTNYVLLHSALLAAASQAYAKQVRFVIVLGDFLAHNYEQNYRWYSDDNTTEGYQLFVKKTLEFLTQELGRAFANYDVFIAIGNNDSYRGDYISEPLGQFYSDTAILWSSLIKNKQARTDMQQLFGKGGYYAVQIAGRPHVRLIVLNSVLFSPHTSGKDINKAALQELEWLHQELNAAHANHQKALIIEHIPAGIDVYTSLRKIFFMPNEFWKPSYTEFFQIELQHHATDILGVIAGHTHMDFAQVLNDIPVSGTPAISPRFGNYPAFKIYRYSSDSLSNFLTYFYSTENMPGWKKGYDFNQVYQPNCLSCKIADGIKLIQSKGDLAAHYIQYFSVGTDSQPIKESNKWNPYYWCSLKTIMIDDYQSCIHQDN